MSLVVVNDIEQMVGYPLSANSRPTDTIVQKFIDYAYTEVNGIARSHGVDIPIDETTNPHAHAIVSSKILEHVAARTNHAHHAVLNNIPPTLMKDIREAYARWEKWLDRYKADKGFLDDVTQDSTDYPRVQTSADVLVSSGRARKFSVDDEW